MAIAGRKVTDWIKTFVAAGVVPPNTRRVIVDIAIDHIAQVYYECYGDTRMFTVEVMIGLTEALKGAEVAHVSQAAEVPQEALADMCRDTYLKRSDGEVADEPS